MLMRIEGRLASLALFGSLGLGCGSADPGAEASEPVVEDSARAPDDTAFTMPPSDDGVSTDSGSASTDTAPPEPGTVPIFVAQGYMGRTILSCDRGETWVGNRSDDDALRCFSGVDCDHNGGRAMGVSFGAGWFAATWGWGAGNSIRRSSDGATWEKVTTNTQFSGVSFAGGRFVAISGEPRVSMDEAKTWTTVASIGFKGHIRSTGSSDFGGGRFIAAGSENGSSTGEVMVSADGKTWKRPKSVPTQCGLAVGWNSIASGKGVTLLVSDDGSVCRSEDGGDTWTRLSLGGTFGGSVVHDGAQFVAFGSAAGKNVAFQSTDGKTWTSKPLGLTRADGTKGVPSLGAVSWGDGRFVSVNGGWDQWYEKQVFFRSDDGVAWTQLPAGAFVGSHPIAMIAFGRVKKPTVCK